LAGRHLVAVGVGVALASFVLRLRFPARSTQILDLHLWQWPQCVGMFALGVAAGRHGSQLRVPPHLYPACGWAVAITLTAVPAVLIGAHITDLAADAGPFVGGWHWQALVLDGVEASLVVAGSVWLCGLAQRWLARTGPRRAGWARASYAAFALQVPVLLTLAITLRPVPWPAEAKAVLVAMVGVPASFWLGRLLVRTRMRQAV
jgi:hypothetical protein